MSKTKSIPRFNVGDEVRVCSCFIDPDYEDLTIGGWAGRIAEVQNGATPTFLVRWSNQTLEKQSSIYLKRCKRDGLDCNEMWLEEGELQPVLGGPLTIERPKSVVSRPLSMNDQDDRIRAVFELTSDDPLPEADDESLVAYGKYLANKLSFPFEAKYSFETGPFQSKIYSITVLGLLDLDDFPSDGYGLFCKARREGKLIELPLAEVEVGKRDPNRRLIEDYSCWFING